MKPANFLRYILLPAIALGAGVKLGIKFAQLTYVSKDRKFIEGEVNDGKADKSRI
jgi:hypothetical protein